MSTVNYAAIAARRRAELLTMIHQAGAGHTGGSLSSIDILVALYYGVMRIRPEDPGWPGRDRFILSKGHSVEGYLCVLADKGFFPKEELSTFCRYKSRLIGHPTVKVPGVEICSGALGHGLSVGVGMALGAKRSRQDWQTYVLMGDGEQAEGSVWEAAMSASHYELENLTAIVDRNRLQISGSTEEVMKLEDFAAKWSAFGWHIQEADGHDIPQLIEKIKACRTISGKPHLIIAKTVKGKGVKEMENVAKWHHGVPDEKQLKRALADLSVEEVSL